MYYDNNNIMEINKDLENLRDLLTFLPLILHKEKQIVSILLANDYVTLLDKPTGTPDDYTFSNVTLTDTGHDLIYSDEDLMDMSLLSGMLLGIADTEDGEIRKLVGTKSKSKKEGGLTDEQVEKYRNVFPIGSRGPGPKIVKHRLERFMVENKCSLDDIIVAARLYIRHNESKGYNIIQAHYFLYKRDPQSKIDESKAEEFLERVKTMNIDTSKDVDTQDWRNKIV